MASPWRKSRSVVRVACGSNVQHVPGVIASPGLMCRSVMPQPRKYFATADGPGAVIACCVRSVQNVRGDRMADASKTLPPQWFVHYTVNPPYASPAKHCIAGPYNTDEVLKQRRNIATYVGVDNVFVTDHIEGSQLCDLSATHSQPSLSQ